MKKMKLLAIFSLVFGLFQCASTKFDKNPPFKINGASFNHYVGGMPGVKGTWVRINYKETNKVVFDSLFFQGRKTKIILETLKNNTYIKGHINRSTVNSKEDLILHQNGEKEYGNKPPQPKIPFVLKDNEAVISYIEDDVTKYFKVENIKQTKTDFYP